MATSSKTHSVYSNGPYHGLPVLPSTARNLTAVITGATGISGQYILRVLLSHSDIWTAIYGLSRKPPAPGTPCADPRVKHIPCDLLSGPDAIASAMKEGGVKDVDYVFFTAYKENSENGLWSGQNEMYEENGRMLEDFLTGFNSLNGNNRCKRVMLQTGAKHYGFHFGEVAIPAMEDECPRLDFGPYQQVPNFYYRQEDILQAHSKKDGFDWVVVRPSNIIGAAAGNFMNEAIAIGLYIAVQKELGEPAYFPGTRTKWNLIEQQSSAMLNAYLEEWAVLTPECSNQAFNAVNGDAPSWARLWPAVLSEFKVSALPDEFGAKVPEGWGAMQIESATSSPIDQKSKAVLALRMQLAVWSKDPKVVAAWTKLRDREGLDQAVWDGASWAFADCILCLPFNLCLAMEKARRFGFHGSVKTAEDYKQVFEEARRLRMLPRA